MHKPMHYPSKAVKQWRVVRLQTAQRALHEAQTLCEAAQRRWRACRRRSALQQEQVRQLARRAADDAGKVCAAQQHHWLASQAAVRRERCAAAQRQEEAAFGRWQASRQALSQAQQVLSESMAAEQAVQAHHDRWRASQRQNREHRQQNENDEWVGPQGLRLTRRRA